MRDPWVIDDQLVGDVLAELGCDRPETPDLPALSLIYMKWCRRVPSDNALKRIHLASGDPSPLPAANARAVLECFLELGVGGTCWGGAMGLHGLLAALGFDVSIGAGPMLGVTPPGAGPGHGCVLVRLDGVLYDVDGYVLNEEPIPFLPDVVTTAGAPWLPATANPTITVSTPDNTPTNGSGPRTPDDPIDTWSVLFRTGHSERRLRYRIDVRTDNPAYLTKRWEASRHHSALNHLFVIRRNTRNGVITYARNKLHKLDPSGALSFDRINNTDRDALLVEQFGLAPSLVKRLPPDEPDAKDIP